MNAKEISNLITSAPMVEAAPTIVIFVDAQHVAGSITESHIPGDTSQRTVPREEHTDGISIILMHTEVQVAVGFPLFCGSTRRSLSLACSHPNTHSKSQNHPAEVQRVPGHLPSSLLRPEHVCLDARSCSFALWVSHPMSPWTGALPAQVL